MPDTPVTRGNLDEILRENPHLENLVRSEIRQTIERNAWRIAAIVLCVWLVGGITVLGVGYVWATQRNQEFAYAVNAGACNARKLIDKSISDTKLARQGYINAARDKSLSASAKARNQKRITEANHSLVAARAFRKLYVTVPSHYNCKHLPRDPPG